MNFLGRKLHGKFEGEIVSDLSSFVCRRTGGSRIKHRVKENWLKMYDKSGLVLRVETVINNPEEFRVRKQVLRKGKPRTEWVAMRKGVAYLFRYREVSLQANSRYLDALKKMRPVAGAPVSIRWHVTTLNYSKASWQASTACEASPTATSDPARIDGSLRACGHDPIKESAKVSRTFRRFHAHSLIAKIPRDPPLARHPLRTPRHGNFALSPGP
ncbi:MAG: hypothetical protein ACREXS_20120 [Gammaproteobacteria bacterium]